MDQSIPNIITSMIENNLAPIISLDGKWGFALADATWDKIQVPGCWEAQGYSKWSDRPACYRRTLFLPATWQGLPIFLEFDAVSYACTVRCNGAEVGQHCGLWTPFAIDISAVTQPGQENIIEVEVYKPGDDITKPPSTARYPMRTTLAGFLPDVATTFGGLWQSVRLRAITAGFQQLHLVADPSTGEIQVQGELYIASQQPIARIQIDIEQNGLAVASTSVQPTAPNRFAASIHIDQPHRWTLEEPVLYTVWLRLFQGEQLVAECSKRVGFRQLSTAGEQLLFNGEPICLRGALSWGWNPDTIAPWYSAEQVRAEIRRVCALGFNLIKLCLFIPNQTYYDIADEEGILLWQEWPLWLPEVTTELRAHAPVEYREYMQLVHHHPSVVLYSVGCELNQAVDQGLMAQLSAIVRQTVDHVLVCDNSGSGEAYGGLAVDFADFTDYHTYGDLHFLEPTLDHWRRDWQRPRPWIFGEFCDSDGFRDLDEIIAANGGQKPWWMTPDIWTHTWRPEVRALLEEDERLAQANPGFSSTELVKIATAQSLMVRKFTLEAVRKRSAVKGYVITGLRDTPIATSGIFDDLDRAKWPAEQFRPFNDDAILCVDVGRSRRWQHGGDRPERLGVYNWWAGEAVRLHVILNTTKADDQSPGELTWQVVNQTGKLIAEGKNGCTQPVPTDRPVEIGVIEFALPVATQAEELCLKVRFADLRVQCANRWPIWSYPRPETWPADVVLYDPQHRFDEAWRKLDLLYASAITAQAKIVITSELDTAVLAYLQQGGSVLLIQQGNGPLPVQRGPFWREAIKLLAPHPIWEKFPQRGFTDLQFFGLATDVMFDASHLAATLSGLTNFTPILRRLDAREFTLTEYLFEAQVGEGRLLACTLRLWGGAGAQPTGFKRNVAGHYLLRILLDYLKDESNLQSLILALGQNDGDSQ
ncbi:MAG: hypothetical protein U0350_20570 [Caldilineaceae bacterium]